jgi:hypothetical protein
LSAESFLSRCQGVKRLGEGRWICKCPAHADNHPSMNVREMPDGKTLVVCRAGCTQEEIIRAVDLHWSALFPAHDNTEGEYRREAAKFPARDVLEALAGEALLVAVAAANIKAGVELTDADRERIGVAAERIMRARTMTNG